MTKMFDHALRSASPDHSELVRKYELYRTIVEFLAALTFIVGSVLFFFPILVYAGTWLFLIGSILFAVRPTIWLMLEPRFAILPVPAEVRPYGVTQLNKVTSA
ncbi:YrhK family protein [Roseibium album]|uniref:YrhK family protein n=1 Tax=Roseibium album TaxID=311410 RepID=UPI00248F99AD|nr:YrhK family protein [Roseibium album]